jgi:hypothetical protein
MSFPDFDSNMKQLFRAISRIIVCCLFYLWWWAAAFSPNKAPGGLRTAPLLLAAAWRRASWR